jgi:hypothetical protein
MKTHFRKARFKDGQHLVQSDLTGRIFYSADARKLWNNLICHKDEYEERNPQDFIRARNERQAIKDARPRATIFLTEPMNPDDL